MGTSLIRITARPAAGWRRCGIRHPAERVDHPADRFTPGQVATLQADPNLIVELVESGDSSNPMPPGESDLGEGGHSGPPSQGQPVVVTDVLGQAATDATGKETAADGTAENDGAAGPDIGRAGGAEGGGRRDTAPRPKAPKAAAKVDATKRTGEPSAEQPENKA